MKGLSSSIFLSSFNFGDKRLNTRLGILSEQLSESVQSSTPATIHDRGQTKAYYRFVNNDKVCPSALIDGYSLYSCSLTLNTNVILAIQDTTTVNFSTKRSAANLDCLESQKDKGFMLHNHLLVNGFGCPIGLFSQRFFARDASGLGVDKATRRKKMLFKDKESYRWFEEFESLQEAYKTATDKTIIQICDREADIHEVLQCCKYAHIHYIIRSAYDRLDANRSAASIWAQVSATSVAFEYILNVPVGQERTARAARMEVRYKLVTLRAGYRKDKSLYDQDVWIVETKEVSPVPSVESPIHWRLLTTIPIVSAAIAFQVIQYYVFRWLIERFHYVLKQGLKVEDLQIRDKMALQNAIILKSWQSLDVMVLNYTASNSPELRLLDTGFSLQDYEIAYFYAQKYCNTKEKKEEEPLLFHFTRLIAQIGGHSLQAKKPVGIVSIWRGWNIFCIIKNAITMLNGNPSTMLSGSIDKNINILNSKGIKDAITLLNDNANTDDPALSRGDEDVGLGN